jgi:hypothetical protein
VGKIDNRLKRYPQIGAVESEDTQKFTLRIASSAFLLSGVKLTKWNSDFK